ncbi:MAG: hypothetical protein ACODAF_01505 [Actinomycetota bacterium]
MSRPFGVVTDQEVFVRADVLESYAVKESRQLPPAPSFEGHRGLLQPKYDPTLLAGLLELNTAHLVACRQKAEDVLGRGWEFEQVAEGADTAERDRLRAWFDAVPAPETALDSQSNRSVLAAAQFDFESIGRGAIELVRRNYAPSAPVETIVHVPATTLRVHRDGLRFVQSKGGKRRWFKWAGADIDVDYETGVVRDLGELRADRRANEIVWWKNYHPSDLVYGLPDVIPAVGAIHGDVGRRDYNLDFFHNFGVPAFAVFVTGDFDEGDFVDKDGEPVDESDPAGKSEMEWHIQSLLKEVRQNPHSSLVFTIPTREGMDDGEVKIEFKPLSTEVKEASFRAYRRDNREEVLSSHRMSAAIAGVYDAGAANREARAGYKQSVLWPRRDMLERLVNHFIVSTFGIEGWRWRLKPSDNRDEEHELDLLSKLEEREAVSKRELRAHFADRFGLDPDAVPEDSEAGVSSVGVPALLQAQVMTIDEGRKLMGLDPLPDGAGDRFLTAEEAGQTAGGGEVGAALMSLRDDLVGIAAKADGLDSTEAAWRRILNGSRR